MIHGNVIQPVDDQRSITGVVASLQLDSPPTKEPSLPTGGSFKLNGKYIYATAVSPATAAYHVATYNTRSGNPWQIQLGRLLPSESRRLSTTTEGADKPFIKFDQDMTLYVAEKLTVPFSIGQKPLLVLRGRRRGTLQGSVIMEKGLGKSHSFKFWHMIPIRRSLSQAEDERLQALMHKRGYRTSDDWRKELLFSVRVGRAKGVQELEWTDDRDVSVAVEKEGQLVMGDEVDVKTRDLLIACWASKNFTQGSAETTDTV